jgi:hypothetical protein
VPAVVHFRKDGTTELLDVVDGVFTTDSFSPFTGCYTVDFHYEGADFSIVGGSGIWLSVLTEALDLDSLEGFEVEAVDSVAFSDPSLIEVSQGINEYGGADWLLRSLAAFDTNETLTITLNDGRRVVMGVTDDQYEHIISDKFKQYVGSIIASTTNPETGEKPTFGQLAQGTIQPHVDMMRLLATQFSAATGLSVTDTGVVNDANPTSSEAIIAQTQTLIGMAEQLNQSNGTALKTIALMALAIVNGTTIEALGDDSKNIMAHFKNPAMPSVAATSDAAMKIASARQAFAQTDTFLEMIGFSQADIRRIKAQERMNQGLQIVSELEE